MIMCHISCKLLLSLWFLPLLSFFFFFFNDTATTEIYTLSLHDALPIRADKWLLAEPACRRDLIGRFVPAEVQVGQFHELRPAPAGPAIVHACHQIPVL